MTQNDRLTPSVIVTVRQAVHDLMRRLDLRIVFGNVGSTEIGFLTGWPTDFQYVTALHESIAVAMADGYTQDTGQAVLVNLHSAVGIGNAMAMIRAARHNRAPVILLAGQQHRRLLSGGDHLSGAPFLGNESPATIAAPYVKRVLQPELPGLVPQALHDALHAATQSPAGPVLLSVPAGDWDQPTLPLVVRQATHRSAASPDALDELADALARATRPMIVAGGPIVAGHAVPDLIAVAEHTSARVMTAAFTTRRPFPQNHPLYAGIMPTSRNAIARVLAPYDLVIVISAPVFTEHTVDHDPPVPLYTRAPLYVIDDAQDVLTTARQGIGIYSAPQPALRGLLSRIAPDRNPKAAPTGSAALVETTIPETTRAAARDSNAAQSSAAATTAPTGAGPVLSETVPSETVPTETVPTETVPTETVPDTLPLTAEEVLRAIDACRPDNAVIVDDAPSHRQLIHKHLPTTTADGYLADFSGALGYGLPAAIGAAVANPARPVIAILGDGATLYTNQSLWTAVELEVNLIVIVLVNRQYAAVVNHATRLGADQIPGTDLPHVDFAQMARSMGCSAYTVTDVEEMHEALATGLATTTPVVLHVDLAPHPDQHPQPDNAPTPGPLNESGTRR